jgi:two-component system LytT family response regulator
MTCIIVDDEELARNLLKEFLEVHDDVEVIGEADRGKEAVKMINEMKPDLVFLDVQMPGMDGFEVIEKLDHMPAIIFSTAYDQYALKAFEKNAVDYLLKPLDQERFNKAIDKIRNRMGSSTDDLKALIETLKSGEEAYPKSLFVQKSEKYLNLNVEDITYLEASGDYTVVSTPDDQFLSSSGISRVEAKLNPEKFIRIHRSTIINLDHLKEIEKHFNGGLVVTMKNGKKFSVSRTYTKKIKEKIL